MWNDFVCVSMPFVRGERVGEDVPFCDGGLRWWCRVSGFCLRSLCLPLLLVVVSFGLTGCETRGDGLGEGGEFSPVIRVWTAGEGTRLPVDESSASSGLSLPLVLPLDGSESLFYESNRNAVKHVDVLMDEVLSDIVTYRLEEGRVIFEYKAGSYSDYYTQSQREIYPLATRSDFRTMVGCGSRMVKVVFTDALGTQMVLNLSLSIESNHAPECSFSVKPINADRREYQISVTGTDADGDAIDRYMYVFDATDIPSFSWLVNRGGISDRGADVALSYQFGWQENRRFKEGLMNEQEFMSAFLDPAVWSVDFIFPTSDAKVKHFFQDGETHTVSVACRDAKGRWSEFITQTIIVK